MYKCPYCGKELRSARGLAPHLRYTNCKEKAIKRQFEEQGKRIDEQVHQMVQAKKREFAVIEQKQRLSNELQSLATSVENTWKPLQNCSICGGTWDNHRPDCPFKKTTSTFDQFIDFMTTLLGGQ